MAALGGRNAMVTFRIVIGVVMMAIGGFLAAFYGIYLKRRELGTGAETPQKRMALYAAIGMGVLFVGGGIVLLVFAPQQ
jgi:drug/metabolite transporter (DMT)-like permease